MALLRCDFFSDVLGLSTSMTVLLPQQTSAAQIGLPGVTTVGPAPVLYLLHGLSDDDTIWLRRTSIERYAAPLGLAVVMPAVERSFYTDEAYGLPYWTFLSEELPAVVDSFFKVSTQRADTFVAGLSMGGYGALKWALRQPERFAAAASLSGALDIASRQLHDHPDVKRIAGDRDLTGSDDDLFALLNKVDPQVAPRLWVSCGADDGLLSESHKFVQQATGRSVEVTSDVVPGNHEWSVWDREIARVLAWFGLDRS